MMENFSSLQDVLMDKFESLIKDNLTTSSNHTNEMVGYGELSKREINT